MYSTRELSTSARKIEALLQSYSTRKINPSAVAGVHQKDGVTTFYYPAACDSVILPIIKKALSHPDTLEIEYIAGSNRIEALNKSVNCHTSAVSFTAAEPALIKIDHSLKRIVDRIASR